MNIKSGFPSIPSFSIGFSDESYVNYADNLFSDCSDYGSG